MKKIIIMLMVLSLSLFAIDSNDLSTAGFEKLNAQQQADVLKSVAAQAEQNKGLTISNAQKVNDWVNVGSNIGKGLAGAAKEVGIAVNDFSKTDVGQLTMYLIVWHIMGDMLYHLFGGLMIWIVGFGFVMIMKNILTTYVETDKAKTKEIKDDDRSALLILSGIIFIAGIIAMFTY